MDLAVARGAAFYGWAKQGQGVRIRGGTARSYYVGIETAGLAIPGAVRPLRALCIVPFGMEEGTELDVPGGEFGLIVGEQTFFRFFSSVVRKQDKPGDLIGSWTEEELSETDSLEATLPPVEDLTDPYVPVRFHSSITGFRRVRTLVREHDFRSSLEARIQRTPRPRRVNCQRSP